jgi:hypothetical protein
MNPVRIMKLKKLGNFRFVAPTGGEEMDFVSRRPESFPQGKNRDINAVGKIQPFTAGD